MPTKKKRISSGVSQLDTLLCGLFIGDNVLWYDDAGSLASVFCINFIQESLNQDKSIIYVSFDRSPKNLIENLGVLAESQNLTVLDCFTNGKGDRSEVFNKFYEKDGAQWPYSVIKVNEPADPSKVAEAIYSLHKTLSSDVRFVFESLTGMQDVWGSEENVLKFYTRTCPKLYELDTIAYWVIEKGAHSNRLKAGINQIAQVAIDLSIKRGKTYLTVVKAERRISNSLNKPFTFFSDGTRITFDSDNRAMISFNLGARIKTLRQQQGLSQKELSGLIGVTPSTISQIESNSIYPSIPALLNIAKNLSVDVGSLLNSIKEVQKSPVYEAKAGVNINFPDMPKGSISGKMIIPPDVDTGVTPYLIEISPNKKLPHHFFIHKGEEMGFLLSGHLEVSFKDKSFSVSTGDAVYLTEEAPSQWSNTDKKTAKLLWLTVKSG
jgi:transcriptional regulator with XRE-family HTH domain/archaellum biogenesis ATPase FlaH